MTAIYLVALLCVNVSFLNPQKANENLYTPQNIICKDELLAGKMPGALPMAGFKASATSVCPATVVQFTDTSSNIPTSWMWSFNPSTVTYVGGTGDTSKNPQVMFNAPGNYDVQLIATNGLGSDTASKSAYINVGTPMTIPIAENFEAQTLCGTTNNCGVQVCPLINGWNNETNGVEDEIDWRVNAGGTTTTNTGPDNDHTIGNGIGKYVYLEASNCFNSTARMISDCIDLTNQNNAIMTFWYHMYGSGMGTMNVRIFSDGNDSLMWTLSGNQANAWHQDTVNLAAFAGKNIKIVFEGITGPNQFSDMALDDINVFSTVGPPVASFTSDAISNCPNFHIQFTNTSLYGPNSLKWSFNPATVNYINGTSDTSQNPEVAFNAPGNYDVQLIATNANGSDTILKPAYIAIGNGVALPQAENFDAQGLCSVLTDCGVTVCPLTGLWMNEVNGIDDQIDWRVNSGATASTNTGPDFDHTTGTTGNYIYTEASVCFGDTARLRSDCIDLSGQTHPTLSFWYHMYGASMGTMNVHVITATADIIVWTKTGDQGNQWINQSVDLSTAGSSTIKIMFEGITGPNAFSDMALDDINIYNLLSPPVADFTSIDTITCTNFGVQFTDVSSFAPTSWAWTFNPSNITYLGGTSSSSQNPLVQFNATGSFDVTLIATNVNGSDTMTTTAYVNVSNGIVLPLAENFDALTINGTTSNCGDEICPLNNLWRNETNGVEDNIDWRVFNAPTPSNPTGPDADHTTGTGNYIYTEASMCQTSTARLASTCIDLTNASYPKLSFWYHMFGIDMGTLNVNVNAGGIETTVWTRTGDQGNQWQGDTLDLAAFDGQIINIVFEGTTGATGNLSDMALDDINVFDQLIKPTTHFTANIHAFCTLNSDTVQFTDATSFGPLTWNWSFNPGTVTFVNGTSSTSQNPTVVFNAGGSYSVALITSNLGGSDTLVKPNFIFANDGSLPITDNFELDTLVSTATMCGLQICNLVQDWRNETNGVADDIDWRVNAGSTPTNLTGPDADHTIGDSTGKYVYLEASNCFNQTALLTSSCIDLTSASSPYLSFWYHMLGNSMGTLHVDVIATDTIHPDVMPTPLGSSVDSFWHRQTVDLSAFTGQIINIRFRGITGAGNQSDMALDDIDIDNSNLPVAGISQNKDTVCVSDNVVFDDNSTGNPTSFNWNFGANANPPTSNTQGPNTVFYTTSGLKTITLIAGNSFGSDTTITTINVIDAPTSGFSMIVSPPDVSFNNNSIYGSTYSWDFGDGGTSSFINPTHTYTSNGTFTITLITMNDCGSDTTTHDVNVFVGLPNLNADMSFSVTPNPSEGIFNLNSSQNVSSALVLEVFDISGRLIWKNTLSSLLKNNIQRIDLLEFAAGIYNLKIQTADGVVVKKLVIQ